jgi:hypothetical protein
MCGVVVSKGDLPWRMFPVFSKGDLPWGCLPHTSLLIARARSQQNRTTKLMSSSIPVVSRGLPYHNITHGGMVKITAVM